MCSIKDGFKLCTCAGEELAPEDIAWILERINPQIPIAHRIGSVARMFPTEEEEKEKAKILAELNARNCFDFEFTPQENDRLIMRKYAYRFQNGQWQIDKSTHLSSWRTQLEQLNKGKIK